jgi:hypothetical protein
VLSSFQDSRLNVQSFQSCPFLFDRPSNIVAYLGVWLETGCGLAILDLLSTRIHHSELHFTQYWHTQTSILTLLQSSLAESWQRFLPREIPQLPALRSSCHSRPCRTQLSTNRSLSPRLATISHKNPRLLSTGWLSTEYWQMNSLTHQPTTSPHLTSPHLNCP